MATMKAVVIREHGATDKLLIKEVPRPLVGCGGRGTVVQGRPQGG